MFRGFSLIPIVVAGCGRIAFDDLTTSDGPPGEPTAGLIASWRFDEGSGQTAVDSSGNGHTATLFAGATWAAGKRGTALSLGGVTAYAAATESSLFDLGTQPWTIAAWVWDDTTAATLGSGAWHRVVAWFDPSGFSHTIGLASDSTVTRRVFFGALRTSTTPIFAAAQDDTPLGWHHVVSTFDGATPVLYVDGVMTGIGTLSNGVAPGIDPATVYIGTLGDGTRFVEGLIDEVRIYKRVLDAAEVTQLYNATR